MCGQANFAEDEHQEAEDDERVDAQVVALDAGEVELALLLAVRGIRGLVGSRLAELVAVLDVDDGSSSPSRRGERMRTTARRSAKVASTA